MFASFYELSQAYTDYSPYEASIYNPVSQHTLTVVKHRSGWNASHVATISTHCNFQRGNARLSRLVKELDDI